MAAPQDDALIAVISAAIAAVMGEDKGFVVRHVRRISNAPAWQKAGREEPGLQPLLRNGKAFEMILRRTTSCVSL